MAFKKLKKLLNSPPVAEASCEASHENADPATPHPSDDMLHINEMIHSLIEPSYEQRSLTGQLLVASPQITEGLFHKSVIYLFSHSEEGAMGCIINQPIEMVHFSALLEQVNIPGTSEMRDIPVHFGGPMERSRGFVLHTDDGTHGYDSIAQHNGIGITAVTSILKDIAQGEGPRKAALVVGYAGWGPGQLEAEMEANGWITVPATEQLLFDTETAHVWSIASQELGIADMAFYSQTVGHA